MHWHLRSPVPPVFSALIMRLARQTHNATAYQLSTQVGNAWLNYWRLSKFSPVFQGGGRRSIAYFSELSGPIDHIWEDISVPKSFLDFWFFYTDTLFCSCDLDLCSMTLIYERDLDILMYLHTIPKWTL